MLPLWGRIIVGLIAAALISFITLVVTVLVAINKAPRVRTVSTRELEPTLTDPNPAVQGTRTSRRRKALIVLVIIIGGFIYYRSRWAASTVTGGGFVSGRAHHISVTLSDGRVLVIGGLNENGPLTSAEVYDPRINKFSRETELKVGSADRAEAILQKNGAVYGIALAGDYGIPAPLTLIEASGSRFTVRRSATPSIFQHSAPFATAALSDGRILLIGSSQSGLHARRIEVYNPATDSFAKTDDLNGERSGGTATEMNGGSVLIAGGGGASSARRAEIWSPSGTVKSDGDLIVRRSYHTATRLADGHVLIIGGEGENGPVGLIERYNLVDGFDSELNLRVPRFGHTSTLLPDGSVLIVGGIARVGSVDAVTDVIERYVPAEKRTTIVGRLHQARAWHSAEVLADGSVIVIGGMTGNNDEPHTFLSSTEIIRTK